MRRSGRGAEGRASSGRAVEVPEEGTQGTRKARGGRLADFRHTRLFKTSTMLPPNMPDKTTAAIAHAVLELNLDTMLAAFYRANPILAMSVEHFRRGTPPPQPYSDGSFENLII